MGCRYQVLLLARVIPWASEDGKPRYSYVGGLHHQSCEGLEPLQLTHQFLKLIKQNENSTIIREEIRLLHGKYGEWKQEPFICVFPCPYAMMLLESTWLMSPAFRMDSSIPWGSNIYSYAIHMLDSKVEIMQLDNNSGLTYIDITDPQNPRCSFASNELLTNPITASEYVREYDLESEGEGEGGYYSSHERSVRRSIENFDDVPLITLEMLAEAWPEDYDYINEKSLQASRDLDNSVKPASIPAPQQLDTAIVTALPSLAELSLKPAVEYSTRIGCTEELEQLLWMPGKMKAIGDIVRSQDPFPDGGLALLAKIIQEENDKRRVDLSSLSLNSGQIIKTIAYFNDIVALNLSQNANVITETVAGVLSILPKLRRLILFGTSITDGEITALLEERPALFYHLESLIHPAFLPLKGETFPNAFSHICFESPDSDYSTDHRHVCTLSLPIFTPSQVVQALTDYFIIISSKRLSGTLKSINILRALYSSELRESHRHWDERAVLLVPQISYRALTHGEGWFFGFWESYTERFGHSKRELIAKFGFVRNTDVWNTYKKDLRANNGQQTKNPDTNFFPAPPSPERYKVYDLYGFVDACVSEGRPAPPTAAVEKLAKLIADFDARPKTSLTLMSGEDAISFVRDIDVYRAEAFEPWWLSESVN